MTPLLEHCCDFVVELAAPSEMGRCPEGTRRIIPIVGGAVSGPMLDGRIMDVGADWQTVTADGVAQLDARYAIETSDGAVIEVVSQGIRDASAQVAARIKAGEDVPPGEYYMRTAVRLSTGAAGYEWVNRSLFLATGGKVGSTVRLAVFRVA